MRRKSVFLLAWLQVLMLCVCVTPASSIPGTNGVIDVKKSSVSAGQPTTVNVVDLDPSREYSIELNDDPVFNWTSNSLETSRTIYLTVPDKPGNYLLVELVDGYATVIDSINLTVLGMESLVPDNAINDTFVVVVGIFIFGGIFVGLIAANRRR